MESKKCTVCSKDWIKRKETVIQFSNSILGWTLTNIVYTVADGSLTKVNNRENVQSQ